MGELTCSKRGCSRKIKYQHIGEGGYYCKGCVFSYFNVSEFQKIGSAEIIKLMIELSKNLLDKVKDYAKKENLTDNWREALDHHKIFYEELDKIKIELDEALQAEKVIISHSLQKRSTDLKSKITDSEAYRKYLLHKDISEHRPGSEEIGTGLPIAKIPRGQDDLAYEKNKAVIAETLHKYKDLLTADLKLELEETKKKCEEDVAEIRRQKEEDMQVYVNAEKLWLDQRSEIENELKETKSKLEQSEASIFISYDVFQNLYQKYIGRPVTLNSSSDITFNLSEEKWMSLLKILSKLKIPQLNRIFLNSVPEDCEEVRLFLSKSISTLNKLYFNNDNKIELSASKYLESLKVASTKTSYQFVVDKTNFSSDEFRELVCTAKGVKRLYFQCNIIPLDEQVDFGNMEGSKVELLGFWHSGGSSYSNWKSHPMRFENLVASIAKSQILKHSLKTLNIEDCGITEKKAQEILDKYNLKSVELDV